ncbi:MAG TPA: helix-turn-helix domain-containing protein [Marinagarivorans sp.]
MNTVLFNINDVVLLTVLVMSAALALLSLQHKEYKRPSRHLLMAFFALNAMIAFDTLAFWGDEVKYAAFDLSPWLLTAFSFATFAFGPVLYGFIRSELFACNRFRYRDLVHLIPALCIPLYFYGVAHRFPLELQRDLILNLGVYSQPQTHFAEFVLLKKVMPLAYGLMCLRLFYATRKEASANTLQWKNLLCLVAGFSLIKLWSLVTHLAGIYLPIAFSDAMGVIGNYMTLVLVAMLMYLGSRNSRLADEQQLAALRKQQSTDEDAEEHQQLQAAFNKIEHFVATEKPHLNPRMTLERFADGAGLPTRTVSLAINHCAHKNFHEYLNGFRIEESKRLLSDSSQAHLTILAVAEYAGFNSKATFNRVFKQSLNTTPTAYRRNALNQPLSSAYR